MSGGDDATRETPIRWILRLKGGHRSCGSEPALKSLTFATLGQLATGRRTGVAMVFGVEFSGFIAWVLWRTVYLMKLPRLPKKLRDGSLDARSFLLERHRANAYVARRPSAKRHDGPNSRAQGGTYFNYRCFSTRHRDSRPTQMNANLIT